VRIVSEQFLIDGNMLPVNQLVAHWPKGELLFHDRLRSYLGNDRLSQFHTIEFDIQSGLHEVECRIELELHDEPEHWEPSDHPMHSWSVNHRHRFEVIPDSAPDPIHVIKNADLDEDMRYALGPRWVPWYSDLCTTGSVSTGSIRHCRVTVILELLYSVETDLALQVIPLQGNEEIPLGTVSWPQGEQGTRVCQGTIAVDDRGNWSSLILRGDRSAIAMTVDMYSAWSGEIRIPPEALIRFGR
jgi:hypothetical protein